VRHKAQTRTHGAAGVVGVALLVAAVFGCGGDDDSDGGAGADGGGLAASMDGSLQQSTLFTTQHALGLSVSFDGDRELRLATIQLDTPLFEPVEPQARDARVRGGGRVVTMPLKYGDADCDVRPADAGPAQLVTEVEGEALRLDLAERPDDLLAGLHAAECEVQAVLDQVDITLGDAWVRTDGLAYAGELTVTQREPGVTAHLTTLEGNVIFAVTSSDAPGGDEPWATVDDDRPSVTLPVTVEAARCDPHVLTEYKRTFVLAAQVQVGEAEPVKVDIVAEGPAHDALAALLEACLPD
jgi:hypothetical protein